MSTKPSHLNLQKASAPRRCGDLEALLHHVAGVLLPGEVRDLAPDGLDDASGVWLSKWRCSPGGDLPSENGGVGGGGPAPSLQAGGACWLIAHPTMSAPIKEGTQNKESGVKKKQGLASGPVCF